jgi:ligand-binding sensor domain-containing protein
MPSEEPLIPLAKAIEELRAELLMALQEGAGKELQFRLKPIQLELKVAVTKSAGADGGIKFWVADFSGKGSYEDAITHTLNLTLEVVGKDGRGEVLISETGERRPD